MATGAALLPHALEVMRRVETRFTLPLRFSNSVALLQQIRGEHGAAVPEDP